MPSKYNRKYPLKRQEKDERDYKVSFEREEIVELPEKIDLRDKCPIIFNQGSSSSCTGQAGTAARMMLDDVDVNTMLSRLYLYYKERELENTTDQDCGATMRNIGKSLLKSGICKESLWNFDLNKITTAPNAEAEKDAQNYKIKSYRALNGVNEIKQYLATYKKPVLLGISIYESFESFKVEKTGVVPMPDTSKEELLGGHAIAIVGYLKASDISDKINEFKSYKTSNISTSFINSFIDWLINLIFGNINKSNDEDTIPDNEIYYICRNSWGNWGDKGYFYLPESFVKDNNLCYDAWTISL